jgi:hypothetical protein
MATHTSSTLDGSMATDAEFRAKGTFIHDVFALGWVQTSDTGQINLASVAKPGTSNTSAGYEIWRMADTLQGTAPVYLKIEYGTASASAALFAIWVTIGSGSDGAGNITGTVFSRTQAQESSANISTSDSFGSADTNRVCFALLATLATAFWFSCERTKDANGDDTDDGLIVAWGSATSAHKSQCVLFGASQPTAENGLQFILSSVSPSTFGSDTGIGIMIPMRGVAQQPGMNVAITISSDFSTGAQISFTIYGVSHTYQIMSNITTLRASVAGPQDSSTRLALRYD